MPKFLEQQLKREYPNNPRAVYGTLNAIGAMKGNRETAKGAAMERKHDAAKPQRVLHPAMQARARAVKQAHAHLTRTMPGFRSLTGAQQIRHTQRHATKMLKGR